MRKVLMTGLIIGFTLMTQMNETWGAGTSGAPFLRMGAGARAAGMGDAFSGVADDVSATYWNPAGLGQLTSPQFSLMQNSGLINSNYQYAAFGMPLKYQALGFSFYRMDHGSMDRYTLSDVKDGSFEASSLAGSVTLATKLEESLWLGASVKYLRESIENKAGSSFAGDLGAFYKMGRTTLAATAHNIGPALKMESEQFPLPLVLRVGASSLFLNNQLRLALEASKPNDNDLTLHGGVEVQPLAWTTLRAGYKITPGNQLDVDGLTGVTGGLGLNLGVLTLDYAFMPFGDLGNTHRISLLFRLNQK